MPWLLVLVVLAGCVSSQPIIKTQTVEIPVPVICKVDMLDKPVWPTEILPADVSRADWLKAALQELNMRIAYQIKIEAVISKCNYKNN